MKRLLAAGSGDIFQLCKAFRPDRADKEHNVEFTILEWYRVGWDYLRLMEEVELLCGKVLDREVEVPRYSFRDVALQVTGEDPVVNGLWKDLTGEGIDLNRPSAYCGHRVDEIVEKFVRSRRDCFVYDFPAGQACFAAIRKDSAPIAERFELFLSGMELANGYQELTDVQEQRRRMSAERLAGNEWDGHLSTSDSRLLGAMEAGLPFCSGVAIGFDRLVMLALGKQRIQEVLGFPASLSY